MRATFLLPAAAAAVATVLPAQDVSAPRTGKVFKSQVDGLIRALHASARPDGSLGDGTCRATARALVYAGHCHRFYHVGDGPWLRRAVRSLFAHRRSDGSFADGEEDRVETTRWVLAALRVMDPEGHRDDIEEAAAFLRGTGARTDSPFDERVAALRSRVAGAEDLVAAAREHAGEVARRAMAGPPRDPSGDLDVAATLDSLETLVAWQVVARGGAQTHVSSRPSPSAVWTEVQQKGHAWLMEQQENGAFSFEIGGRKIADPGITSLGVAALQTKPLELRAAPERRAILEGVRWLLSRQNKDGSFGRSNLNYTTCAAVMALSMCRDPALHTEVRAALDRAQKFLLFLQNVEERGYRPQDRDYGSIGYGGDERGDLSNLQFALDALRRTGLGPEHEAFQKAIVFLQRTQNLASVNDLRGVARDPETGERYRYRAGNDGGAVYYPGNSPAGYVELPDGTRIPRSYGSMTYALLKAYTLAGLPREDPRIQAAVRWIAAHWTLDENPGADPRLPEKTRYQGLYYYYLVLAQALDIAGIDQLEVRRGEGDEARTERIDWRKELADKLAQLQRPDGSWVNDRNGRWFENLPALCTSYAMLALHRCHRHR